MSALDVLFDVLLGVHVSAALGWLVVTLLLVAVALRARGRSPEAATAAATGPFARRLTVGVFGSAGLGILAGFSLYAFELRNPSYAPSPNGWMYIQLGAAFAILAFAVSALALRPLRTAQRTPGTPPEAVRAALARFGRFGAVATVLLFAALASMVVGGTI